VAKKGARGVGEWLYFPDGPPLPTGLLGPEYVKLLQIHGVAHVYNHWSSMPTLAEQHTRMGSFTAPFTVLRLLTQLKMSYEAAKKRAEPYDKIVGELPEMRKDTVSLVKQAVAENRRAYVLVNNRSEGNDLACRMGWTVFGWSRHDGALYLFAYEDRDRIGSDDRIAGCGDAATGPDLHWRLARE
jgi:hypothetical protein